MPISLVPVSRSGAPLYSFGTRYLQNITEKKDFLLVDYLRVCPNRIFVSGSGLSIDLDHHNPGELSV